MRGILGIQRLKEFYTAGHIKSTGAILPKQFQPNTLDLTLGATAYRVRSSFLTTKASVQEKIDELLMYTVDLSEGAILEKDKVYIIPLREALELPGAIYGKTNPKSSTGHLDIFTRVIIDRSYRFNNIPRGYQGPLYLEICPKSFTIRVSEGDSLCQLRLITGEDISLSDEEILELYGRQTLLYDTEGAPMPLEQVKLNQGLFMSIDLSPTAGGVIGFKTRKNSEVIDVGKVAAYPYREFWEPIPHNRDYSLILEPEEFYIFASNERILVPPGICGEMVPYDPDSAEMRVHYAGFFDTGFGNTTQGLKGAKAVFEMRAHDIPFLVEHGQVLFRIVLERNAEPPQEQYGATVNSSYQGQGLKLSKHFIMDA